MWLQAIKLAAQAGSKIYANRQKAKMAMSEAQLLHAEKQARGERGREERQSERGASRETEEARAHGGRADDEGGSGDGAHGESKLVRRHRAGFQVLGGPERSVPRGRRHVVAFVEVLQREGETKTRHRDLLEPGVHRFVRRRVRFVRLREADERFDLLLLAQEPFPPRVRVHHRERRDVPGLPPFALFVVSGRPVRRVRVGVRREEQDEPPHPPVRREDGEAHRPGVAGEVAAARREREGSGVHVGVVGRARDALDHVQVRARVPGRDGAQAGGGCRGGGR